MLSPTARPLLAASVLLAAALAAAADQPAKSDAGWIDLVHLDVPEHDFDGVTTGWEKYYWTPWRECLERK